LIFSIPDGQITIDWFTSEGNFFMVSVNDKTNQIFFHVVDNNGNYYFSKMIPADFEWFNQYKKKEAYTFGILSHLAMFSVLMKKQN
jgi:hypothetical protein